MQSVSPGDHPSGSELKEVRAEQEPSSNPGDNADEDGGES